MSLLLAEITPQTPDRSEVEATLIQLAEVAGSAGGSLLDAQVSEDLSLLFAVVEFPGRSTTAEPSDTLEEKLSRALAEGGIDSTEPAEVRLVGSTISEVRARGGAAGYLVEWDLPEGLTMDAYLERKKAKSPLYAEVPEVAFLRTYVREDLGKCLCFYDAPDEDCVKRARDVVGAPVDRLHQLSAQSAPEPSRP